MRQVGEESCAFVSVTDDDTNVLVPKFGIRWQPSSGFR